jgi:hypothetical protein
MTEDRNFKVCLIPIDAQPPTFGMVMSIMGISGDYDEIVICVRDNPIILDTETVITMLSFILKLPKFMIISNPQNFEHLVELSPDIPFFTHVATLSERVYTNFIMKGYICTLIPRVMGYDEQFHRQAWKQSVALEFLRSRTRNTDTRCFNKKSEPSTQKEGD